ncbi:unnamed protein product, partial [Cyprideis torosa]
IERGEWTTGNKIPTEAELAQMFGASRMTVNRALRELAVEGRLARRQGLGTFVTTPKQKSAMLEISSIAEEIKKSGGRYSCTVHLLREEKITPVLALGMEVRAYSPVFHSVLVHKKDGVPLQLADRYVNPAMVPVYLEQDFSRITPSEYLLSIAPAYNAEHTVEAVLVDGWIGKLLDIHESEPCLALHRKTWAE